MKGVVCSDKPKVNDHRALQFPSALWSIYLISVILSSSRQLFLTQKKKNQINPWRRPFSASDRQTATRWWTYCIVEHLAAKLPDISLWIWWGPNTEMKGERILDLHLSETQRNALSQCEPHQDPGSHRCNSFSQRCPSSTPWAHGRVPQASQGVAALSNSGLRGWSRYLPWQLGDKGQWRFLQEGNGVILHSHKEQ